MRVKKWRFCSLEMRSQVSGIVRSGLPIAEAYEAWVETMSSSGYL